MVRGACIDNNGLKKGEWSKEEDQKLSAYVLRYGHWNWRLVPKYAGLNRCGKSCRLRWMNYLKPGVKRGNFTKEEGELIKRLHDELGNKWSAIAARLPGRTDNEIKNYWHTQFDKRNRRKSGQQQQTKVPKETSSEINATHWKNPTNSSEMVRSCLQQEFSDGVCPDVYILDSSSGSSDGVSEGAANWDLGSVLMKNVGSEMRSEPSDSLGFSYGGSDDGASSSSGSFPGFQESFVVDTSYIQEFDFSMLDDCESYYSQIMGFENDHDVKLF